MVRLSTRDEAGSYSYNVEDLSITRVLVLGKLPVPRHPTIWMIVGQGPIALAVGAGGGCFDIFTVIYPFSLSLWETARYRLKHCLEEPLNPKQPTNLSLGSYIHCCVLKRDLKLPNNSQTVDVSPLSTNSVILCKIVAICWCIVVISPGCLFQSNVYPQVSVIGKN